MSGIKLRIEDNDRKTVSLLSFYVKLSKDVAGVLTGVSWRPDRRLDVVVTMVLPGWGVWALFPCGLVLVICSSVCLSQEPHIKPADCSRKEHPVVSYQGEWISTVSFSSSVTFYYHCSTNLRDWGKLVNKELKFKEEPDCTGYSSPAGRAGHPVIAGLVT